MIIGIVGAGGIGGFFAGILTQAGHSVSILVKDSYLAAANGRLKIESPMGNFTVTPRMSSDPRVLSDCEVVFITVKTWAVTESAKQIEAALSPTCVIVPMQNGVDAVTELCNVFGPERVLGGLVRVVSFLIQPGVIKHVGVKPSVSIGELNGELSGRLSEIAAALRSAGVTVTESNNIVSELWQKFMFMAAWSGVGSIVRRPIGEIRSYLPTRKMLENIMREVVAIAATKKIIIADSSIDNTLKFIDALPYESTASMQRDIMAGKRSELEAQTGAVVRLGAEAGILTPVSGFVYHALALQEKAVGQ